MSQQLSRRKAARGNLSFDRLGIIAKPDSESSANCIKKLFPILKKYKVQNPNAQIFLDRNLNAAASKSNFVTFASEKYLSDKLDLLLSVGGDGTLLRAARLLLLENGWKHTSLLGVNTGRLGFLTLLGNDATSELSKILKFPFQSQIEPRSCLEVRILRGRRAMGEYHVLNDSVLKSGALSRLIEFGISMNGEFLSRYRADGLIVSTPTGSTAYNLAASGAILEPRIPAIQLTPICAQSFSNKPIVISDENLIEISIDGKNSDAHLTLDGHTGIGLRAGDRIVINRSPKSISLLLPSGRGRGHYIHSLRQKLKWGLVSPHSS